MARAWKQLRHEVLQSICPPGVSQLSLLQRDPAALQRLEALLQGAGGQDPLERAKLASILDLKGEHLEAQKICGAIDKCDPGTGAAIKFLEHLVSRHVSWQEDRARRITAETRQKVIPVEVLSGDTSREELWRRFVEPGIPCVLRGVELAPFHSLKDVKATVGKVKVPIRRCDESSTNWARLEFDRVIQFDNFMEEFIEPFEDGLELAPRNSPQLFDFSIWQQCAESLGNQLSMPSKWFPVDLYTYASARMQPVSGSACPTLFVAPRGSGSSLHVDTLQTNFWMCMCLGRKRWRLVSRDDIGLLHPQYFCDLNPVFPRDLNAAHPVTIYETILEAGDLIFVPAGWPHQVENLETSVAISANFIDTSNVHRCIEEAEIMGSVEDNSAFWAKVLRTAVQNHQPEQLASAAQSSETLREFKARHGEGRAPYEIQRRLLQGLGATLSIGGLCILIAWYRSRLAESVAPVRATL